MNINKSNKHFLFYALVSTSNEEDIRYIGTTSTTLKARFRQHKYCANHEEKRGLPVHKWMYSQYQKGFDIKIIQLCECEENEWENTEQQLILKYKNLGYKLLNVDKGGKGVITKEKRSKSSIERSTEAHRKPIVQLTTSGEFVQEYKSLTEAGSYFDGTINNIFNVLKGTTKTAFGYVWVYKDKYDPKNIYTVTYEPHTEKVFQFNREGNLVKSYNSKKEAVTNIKGSYNGLTDSIKNKTWYKNSFWSYSDTIHITEYKDPFKYKIYQNDLLVAEFTMQKEAAKFVGIAPNNLKIRLDKCKNVTTYNDYCIKLMN